LLLEMLRNHKDHPTADVLYREVKEVMPQISLGTVYRNLKTLARRGVICRITVPDGPDRYDPHTGFHPHFVCIGCGKVEDIPEDVPVPVIREEGDWFRERVVQKVIFQLYGLCRECRNKDFFEQNGIFKLN